MAPKSLPPAAKQASVLQWFRTSLAAHSLKELEKVLPAAASISSMQVKDYIQALTDEGLVRVEKIGSGNWYWSFASDARESKQRMLRGLKEEEDKLNSALNDVDTQLAEETRSRACDDPDADRDSLMQQHKALTDVTTHLQQTLEGFKCTDAAVVTRQQEETVQFREMAQRWTDHLEGLEQYLINLTQDRGQVAEIMANACGDEYVRGEGLKEL